MTGNDASIQANAAPMFNTPKEDLPHRVGGGSGGYIYIQTLNQLSENHFGKHFVVQADGGYGIGERYGGSGGLIVLDGLELPHRQVSTSGGLAIGSILDESGNGCGTGASGAVYFKNSSRLLLDNKDKRTDKFTILNAPEK